MQRITHRLDGHVPLPTAAAADARCRAVAAGSGLPASFGKLAVIAEFANASRQVANLVSEGAREIAIRNAQPEGRVQLSFGRVEVLEEPVTGAVVCTLVDAAARFG